MPVVYTTSSAPGSALTSSAASSPYRPSVTKVADPPGLTSIHPLEPVKPVRYLRFGALDTSNGASIPSPRACKRWA